MGPLDTSIAVETSKPRNRKKVALLAGVLIAALIPVVQSTFAANIAINSGTIEFGQGVTQVTACDPSVTLTPFSEFDNGTNTFTLSSFNLADGGSDNIGDLCAGKTFTVNVRDASSILETFAFTLGRTGAGTVGDPYVYSVTDYNTDKISSASYEAGVFTFNVLIAGVDAASIAKITVETN